MARKASPTRVRWLFRNCTTLISECAMVCNAIGLKQADEFDYEIVEELVGKMEGTLVMLRNLHRADVPF